MALLSSDRLVVADVYNHSVKLVDVVQGKVLHQLEVDGEPSSVCSLPATRAAVTMPAEKRILILDCAETVPFHNTIFILKCDNQLSVVKTITVHGRCEEVAYSNDHLIVLYTQPSRIEILTMNGRVVKRRDLELSKTYLYKYLSVIAEDNVTSVYVSDDDSRRILRLDENLQVQQVYPVPDGAKPGRVLAVGDGQLLVSDLNGTLWQLDSTMGRWTLLNQAEWFLAAYSMAFCHERNNLYWDAFGVVKRYAIS